MKALILRWLLKLRYRIEVEGVVPASEPFTVYSLFKSELDPLFLAAYVTSKKGIVIGVPEVRSWVRRVLSLFSWIPLPIFSERSVRFFGRRLLRLALPAFEERREKDWIILIEGASNPLPKALSSEKRSIVFAKIDGMVGSRFLIPSTGKQLRFWRAFILVLQNGIFWMPKRKITLTFQEAEGDFLKPTGAVSQEVPDFFWGRKKTGSSKHEEFLLREISRLSKKPISSLQREMRLYDDLMLDSLDVTELVLTIEKEFHHQSYFPTLETVQDVLDAGQGISRLKEDEIQEKTIRKWSKPRPDVKPPEGKSIGRLSSALAIGWEAA